ncbi:MAG: Gfo/Idh/MocA family oxidoreductase [Bacteroidota bacterium]|nr:Gfo/Idh/MocA family oxidoreductase [Bacteroidota bacterium]
MNLKVGIIGVGHFGKNHIRCHKEGKFKLVGFYDIDKEVSDNVEKEFGISQFPAYEALLKEVDMVDIVVPTNVHFEVAKKAIIAGKHVFIEKPVTSTPDQALELKNLAIKNSVKIQVGHIERFNPAFTSIKNHINNPKFIELHRLGQFHPRNKDVPVVMDLMIHDIDIILNVVNSKVKFILSSGVPIISDTPDITNARVEFENGCIVNMTASRISLKPMRKLRLFQSDAYLSIDFLEKKSEVVRIKKVDKIPADPFAMIMDLGEGKPKKQIFFESPDIVDVNALVEELNSFYESILNNASPVVSIDDGYEALKLANEIMEKMNSNVQ